MHDIRWEQTRVEQDLIQTWRNGGLAAPASPLEAAALAMRAPLIIKGAKTFPSPSPQPSEAEFAKMLAYIVNHYHLSPDFPCCKAPAQARYIRPIVGCREGVNTGLPSRTRLEREECSPLSSPAQEHCARLYRTSACYAVLSPLHAILRGGSGAASLDTYAQDRPGRDRAPGL